MTQETEIGVRRAAECDLPVLRIMSEKLGGEQEPDYFERCLTLQDEGKRLLLIGACRSRDVAYGILNWSPKYALFKKLGIPEIQDLNVLPDFRRRGIASFMIHYCEDLAREKKHEQIGIGVGLHASYGPAQRLYVRLGYVPDGMGVTYDRKQLCFGEFRPVDDNLCLMMVKDLWYAPET